jgi:hypothetical protein
VKTIQVQLDELLVTVREFTLDSYPEAQTALEGTVSGDKTQRRDAIRSLLKECTDVPDDKMGTISLREWSLVSTAIMEANGFKKKDEAPVTEAPESPTPTA